MKICIKKYSPVSLFAYSQAYFNLNEFSKAIVDAKVALDMDRSNIKAWYALGHALFGASKYDGCLAACHNGLEYVRDDPVCNFYICVCFVKSFVYQRSMDVLFINVFFILGLMCIYDCECLDR